MLRSILLLACALGTVATALPAAATPATRPTTRPLMVSEAELPEGFPPPGRVGEVMVKRYPAYRAARTTVGADANHEPAAQDSMFRTLFRHIQEKDIAMTAPVEMTYGRAAVPAADAAANPTAMAFLYGTPRTGAPGKAGEVEVVDVPPMTVISLAVRGDYNATNFQRALATLRDELQRRPDLAEAGPPRYLGYNSPFVPWFARFGEVQVPVRTR